MKAVISSLLNRSSSRYVIVGVSIYIFEVGVIIVAQGFGASSIIAVGLSFWLGLIISFGLQKFLTFKDKRIHRRILLPQIAAVLLLVLFNFGLTVLAAKILADVLPAIVIRTFVLGLTTIWNFYLYKTRIFKPSEEVAY